MSKRSCSALLRTVSGGVAMPHGSGSPVTIGQRYRNVVPEAAVPLQQGGLLIVSSGSIVEFKGDAIVNAANEGCITGGGVDGAITAAGGQALRDARRALPTLEDGTTRCPVGSAVITEGGDLDVRYCIHAVGPNYKNEANVESADSKLASAYRSALDRGYEKRLSCIGFSLISSGIYRGDMSLEHVLRIGVRTLMCGAYEGLEEVHLCAFTDDEMETLLKLVNMECSRYDFDGTPFEL